MLRTTATAIAWAVVTVTSLAGWFTAFSVQFLVIPCLAVLMLDALSTLGRLQARREPKVSPAAQRGLRIALVPMIAAALCGMYASIAPSHIYRSESHQISGIIAPALWLLIIVVACRAFATSSPQRVAKLSLVAVASWPLFLVLGALSGLMLDVPMAAGYEIPRWALAVFTSASAAVVGGCMILARLCTDRPASAG